MLDSVTTFLDERRRGLQRAAGYVGAGYLVAQYVRERIEDVRARVVQDRAARENLRRRFEQNQEDVAFTVMALLPTLGRHILDGMDVEGVTQELQSLTRGGAPKPAPTLPPPPPALELQPPVPPSESSVTPSRVHVHPDAESRSESGSASSASCAQVSSPDLAASSTSWVEAMQSSAISSSAPNPSDPPGTASPQSNLGTELSESMTSASSGSGAAPASDKLSPPESTRSDATSLTKSKAELWREVKMLTFTRTLTILYSVALLSLFTHVQLSILGRARYVQSVLQLEEDERLREELADRLSIYSLFWGDQAEEQEQAPRWGEDEFVGPETEMKYLTLSWWILHVGWKDVGERVRRAVEEVFEGVSLKSKLTVVDVHHLIADVRRRVEYEVTFEGKERRINFLSTLLPPTPETLQHVLTQGGVPARAASLRDARFARLLAETRAHLQSASCARVLEVCVDRAAGVLDAGVRQHVFGGGGAEGEGGSERLAGMLPGLARWCHSALEGLPNALVDELAGTREMEVFAAIIYSDYEKRLV